MKNSPSTHQFSTRVIRMLAAIFVLAMACGAAKADTIATYDINATFASGGTLTGTFTYDFSPYSGGVNPIIAANITADGVNFTNCPGGVGGTCNLYDDFLGHTADGFTIADASGYPFVQILWSAIDLSNPPNTLTLLPASYCVGCGENGIPMYGTFFDFLVSGTATDPPNPDVQTPENGTLTMLLSGMLALGLFAAWQTRRKVAAQAIVPQI